MTAIETGNGFGTIIKKSDMPSAIDGQHANIKVVQNNF